jgi:predicted MFS family arabinose efflux permease
MRLRARAAAQRAPKHVLVELREGFGYASSFGPIRVILMLLAFVSLTAVPYSVLMPIFASQVLHGGPHTLGLLMGAAGLGALTGALYLASRTSVLGLAAVINRCSLGLGVGMLALELASQVAVALPLMFVIGMAMMMQMAATNTLIQSIVDDKMLGRVISLYAVAFFGGAPIGSLLEGTLANQIGAIHTFAVAGGVCVAAGLAFAAALPGLRRVSRPHYIKLGLIPDPAAPSRDAGAGSAGATHRTEAE